jgi:hypothetical protein
MCRSEEAALEAQSLSLLKLSGIIGTLAAAITLALLLRVQRLSDISWLSGFFALGVCTVPTLFDLLGLPMQLSRLVLDWELHMRNWLLLFLLLCLLIVLRGVLARLAGVSGNDKGSRRALIVGVAFGLWLIGMLVVPSIAINAVPPSYIGRSRIDQTTILILFTIATPLVTILAVRRRSVLSLIGIHGDNPWLRLALVAGPGLILAGLGAIAIPYVMVTRLPGTTFVIGTALALVLLIPLIRILDRRMVDSNCRPKYR